MYAITVIQRRQYYSIVNQSINQSEIDHQSKSTVFLLNRSIISDTNDASRDANAADPDEYGTCVDCI